MLDAAGKQGGDGDRICEAACTAVALQLHWLADKREPSIEILPIAS